MKHLLKKALVLTAIAGLFAALLYGCTEAPKEKTALSFHSFDGDGPEYSVEIGDASVLSCQAERHYAKANHEELNGAGYDVVFAFGRLKEGKTTVTVTCTLHGTEEDKTVYDATVDGGLKVTLEKREDIRYEEETT